jgi:ankyrin repeat protein
MVFLLFVDVTWRVLCFVFFRGHSKMVSVLLKQKADPNCRDIEGNSPLHMACEEDRTHVAQILVENEADVTLLNKVYTQLTVL